MRATSLALAAGCGAATPQQEAGSSEVVADMDTRDGPADYEDVCGMDFADLSPAAQALVEEHGRAALGETMRTLLAGEHSAAVERAGRRRIGRRVPANRGCGEERPG